MALGLVESHTTDIKAGDLITRCVLCIGGWTENIKLLCSDGWEARFSHGVEVTQIFPFGKPVLDKQISLSLNTASPLYNYGHWPIQEREGWERSCEVICSQTVTHPSLPGQGKQAVVSPQMASPARKTTLTTYFPPLLISCLLSFLSQLHPSLPLFMVTS